MRQVVIPPGPKGLPVLFALTARPPSNRSPERHNSAIKIIDQYARWGHFEYQGEDHPQFPREGRRSKEDRLVSLKRLFLDFRKATEAGRAFRSSIAARYAGNESGDSDFQFRWELGDFTIPIPRTRHEGWIRETAHSGPVNEGREPKQIRKDIWDRWAPTVHIAAAFANILDGNIAVGNNADWDRLCDSLLFNDNSHLTPILIDLARQFESAAEEISFWRGNDPISVVAA